MLALCPLMNIEGDRCKRYCDLCTLFENFEEEGFLQKSWGILPARESQASVMSCVAPR